MGAREFIEDTEKSMEEEKSEQPCLRQTHTPFTCGLDGVIDVFGLGVRAGADNLLRRGIESLERRSTSDEINKETRGPWVRGSGGGGAQPKKRCNRYL